MHRHILPLLAALWSSAAIAAPVLQIDDQAPLSGTPFGIRITGLMPGQAVDLKVERNGSFGDPAFYRSVNRYVADIGGQVDLGRDAPVGGSYTGADPFGPFWSARRDAAASVEGITPNSFRLSIDANQDGRSEDVKTLYRARALDQATTTELGDTFPGAIFVWPATNEMRVPVIIALGGSEGGSAGNRAFIARFVDRGYGVLALPYYSPQPYYSRGLRPEFPALPRAFANIPVDRLEAAIAWLKQRSDVDGRRLGLIGVSKGAEMALIAASRMDVFKAIAAIVPSDVVWEGWGPGTVAGRTSSFTWRGEPLPFVPYLGMEAEIAKFARGEIGRVRTPHDAGRAANPERIAAARIPVERIEAPVLVAGGGLDQTWASGDMAEIIAATRDRAGLSTVKLVYPQAGHALAGDGMDPGDAASSQASREIFARTVEFFAQALEPAGGGLAATSEVRR